MERRIMPEHTRPGVVLGLLVAAVILIGGLILLASDDARQVVLGKDDSRLPMTTEQTPAPDVTPEVTPTQPEAAPAQ